ncbi:Phosphatidyl-N-methylethanolamine N-methyltransferase [Entomophthora muscae]|uniref:Phosphatidyl-N-methylethanolamine N-methyltransferase n=1 Tax=Entomophthora muscae TaxID=34485 RepID=A0ACC2T1C5_9FUNG|nr:Phosphatidyl-N-methylethanolamine N-methyltransferase [Entomophthora muscae]
MSGLFGLDFSHREVYISAVSICFNPLFWNIVARNEHYNRTLTRLTGNRPQLGCYILAMTIFSLGIVRDLLYKKALETQPVSPLLTGPLPETLGLSCIALGNLFVISSTLKLGITGTFLGDYFGILMDEPVTSFPFNVVANPMYHGSSLIFFGTALWLGRFMGIILTGLVVLVYWCAIQLENPFTSMIYAQRESSGKDAQRDDGITRTKTKKLS